MFVQAGVAGGFNESDLWQRAIFQVGEILRNGGNLVRPIFWNGLSPGKKMNVTEPHEAGAVVRRSGAWAMGWVDVDSPADAFALQLLEDRRDCEVLAVPAVTPHLVHVPLRGCSIEVFTVGVGSCHDRVKPSVRGGEVRCHEVVVVEIFARVIAHGALAVGVKVGRRKKPGIMGSGADESVHLGGTQSERIVDVPVAMGFVPRGAGVLGALGEQFERSYGRTVGVYLAIARRRKRGVATGYGWRRPVERRNTRRGIELRQAIEGLIGIAVLCPVLAQLAEVLIEGAVLLGQNDDVTETAEAGYGGGLRPRRRRLRPSSCR